MDMTKTDKKPTTTELKMAKNTAKQAAKNARPMVTVAEWIEALRTTAEMCHGPYYRLAELPETGLHTFSAQGILACLFVLKYPNRFKWTKKGKFKDMAEGSKNGEDVFEIVYTDQVSPLKAMEKVMSRDVPKWEDKGATFKVIADKLEAAHAKALAGNK